MNPCQQVRESTAWVCQNSTHVRINHDAIQRYVRDQLTSSALNQMIKLENFDTQIHFVDDAMPELMVRYFLVLDACNFCFFLQQGLEYDVLSVGLKRSVTSDARCLDLDRLSKINSDELKALFQVKELPLSEERARNVREVATVLMMQGVQALDFVSRAQGSATALVHQMITSFKGFRDSAVYKGREIFFLKRAQIFVGDLYGAFHGHGYGEFKDIDQLTMFADYRVPVVLRSLGILVYSESLADIVDRQIEITPGSEYELEMRASTIQAVESMKNEIYTSLPKFQSLIISLHIDWLLWEYGEKRKSELGHHHRCITTYY